MKPFQLGGPPGPGRPKGVRNRFNAVVYETTLAFLLHPIGKPAPSEYEGTELWGALRIAQRNGSLLKFIGPMLDRSFTVEHTKLQELPDDWLEQLIADRRQQFNLLELKAEPLPEMLPHARD